ncbi:unnamed protein product [Caenorhabditis auriculariae]|uniref:Cortactin-binding protein-2 N-terminal domain-containing protein n=1 Tax=Caenorhabditis auriculariae TaxID=2777116 RepID=A0A8S1H5Z9_9PELO|nr:unnamed protein product [Caenorhabditis auriculariae]
MTVITIRLVGEQEDRLFEGIDVDNKILYVDLKKRIETITKIPLDFQEVRFRGEKLSVVEYLIRDIKFGEELVVKHASLPQWQNYLTIVQKYREDKKNRSRQEKAVEANEQAKQSYDMKFFSAYATFYSDLLRMREEYAVFLDNIPDFIREAAKTFFTRKFHDKLIGVQFKDKASGSRSGTVCTVSYDDCRHVYYIKTNHNASSISTTHREPLNMIELFVYKLLEVMNIGAMIYFIPNLVASNKIVYICSREICGFKTLAMLEKHCDVYERETVKHKEDHAKAIIQISLLRMTYEEQLRIAKEFIDQCGISLKLDEALAKLDEDKEVDDDKDDEKILKIVVVGDGASGKTSICQRFAKETFDKSYHQTLGLDFFSRRLILPGDVQVQVQVWDIGGQSIAGEMVDKYVAGTDIAFIVYDVTNVKSFDNVQDWLSVVKRVTKNQEKLPQIILVANKTDLEEKRVVPIDQHNTLAKKYDMKAIYVSAKTGDSVLLMFKQAVADVLKIVLTKADQEADILIVQGTVADAAKVHEGANLRRTDRSKNTARCVITAEMSRFDDSFDPTFQSTSKKINMYSASERDKRLDETSYDNYPDDHHVAQDFSKEELVRLIVLMEGELEGREQVIDHLKKERTKILLAEAKYGKLSVNDPFSALRRDSAVTEEYFDEQQIGQMYESQVAQLDRLIATQRKLQNKSKLLLSATEKNGI